MIKLKNTSGLFFLMLTIIIAGCSNAQTQQANTNLSVSEFSEKIKTTNEALIIDVRTPAEFSKGHLQNAVNIDWNGKDFNNHIVLLDKEKPVMVYCLSGARSASAANKMRSMGFTEVYEMKGGIMKWNAESLPVANKSIDKGMSLTNFENLLNTEKLVLVDFYADWCLPCKKMKPYLDEISREMATTVEVIRINVDENTELYKELKVEAIPVLQIYKNKKLIWSNQGFISKEKVVEQLK